MSQDAPSRAGRRATDAVLAERKAAAEDCGLPTVVTAPQPKAGEFDAQLLGQGGQKRGLRGGKPVLDQARSAYLETEWSGPSDRRPPKGLLKKTSI